MVNNDEIAVVAPFRESKNSTFQVFDKHQRTWHVLRTPFPCLFVKAFRYWLAFIASDPAGDAVANPPKTPSGNTYLKPGGLQAGSAEARKRYISSGHDSVEDVLMQSGHNHPGKLFVINQRTGEQLQIDTGEADSEVVWADDQQLVYRVNDRLIQAPIKDGQLQNPVTLAMGDEVPGVHWLFR